MQFARVIGTVVANRKYEGLDGIKFLVVQPLTKQQEPIGKPVVAADGTAQALPEVFVPVDHAIVGIVDDVQLADVSGNDRSG
jgi:ethanolamine utilization protein EutN